MRSPCLRGEAERLSYCEWASVCLAQVMIVTLAVGRFVCVVVKVEKLSSPDGQAPGWRMITRRSG